MKRVLGLDLGEVRTGVAVSDELKLLAHPLETIESESTPRLLQRLQQIISEKEVDCVVVGLPRHMNGALGTGAENARLFAEKLRALIACEVVTWDERLSSVAADRLLREVGRKTRKTKGIRDQVAAQMILQGYLDRLNA